MESITLKLATDHKDLETARKLRTNHHSAISCEDNFEHKERMRDELGIIFLFEITERPIATVRLVPLGYNLTLVESLFESHEKNQFNINAWEVGRLVIDPQYRGLKTLTTCLAKAFMWARENTNILVVFAACKPKMAILYQRFGFQALDLDENVRINRNNQQRYAVIRAPMLNVFKKLSRAA